MAGNPNDPIYCCAKAYQNMIDEGIAFEIEIVSGNKIETVEIRPNESEYKHLSGIHHFDDVRQIKNMDSEDALSNSISGILSLCTCQKSIHFNDVFSGGYRTIDRINMLTDYHKTMESINPKNPMGTLKIFAWKRDAHSYERPYNSTISADYLFQFQVKGSNYPYINYFF